MKAIMPSFKKVSLFLFYLSVTSNAFAQLPINFMYTVSANGVKPHVALKQAFTEQVDTSFVQTDNEVVWVRFRISPTVLKGESLFLKSAAYNQIFLYEVDGSKITIIGTAGEISPLTNPNTKRDIYSIEIKDEIQPATRDFLVALNVGHSSKKIIFPKIYTTVDFENYIFKRNSSLYESVWKPVYFGILLFFMGITCLYYFFSRERMFLFYFFYLLFISLRSALAGNLVVPEQLFPFLQNINFSGRHFQTVTFLSFIFYYKFIEEITDAKSRPKVFKQFLKVQYAYLGFMILFDMAFVIEKYANPLLYTIFKSLEVVGLILGFVCICFLLKYYNSTIKYILVGIISFFMIALFGQEIIIFFSGKSRMEQRTELSIVWSIAYLVELSFFAVAIIKRAVDSQKQNVWHFTENERLKGLLEKPLVSLPVLAETIIISSLNEKMVVNQADIIRLEASGSYTVFYILGQKPVVASHNLSEFEAKLSPVYFMRVHKSHVVNSRFIEKYAKKDNSFLTLTTGEDVPVSRTKKKFVELQLGK